MDFSDYNLDFDVEDFLEKSQEKQRERLEQELERIEDQLEERSQIHRDAINELESKRDWYIDRLETLYQRGVGKQGKREKLKTRIEELYTAIRTEKRSHWQDRQELENKKREALKEMEELKSLERFENVL